MHQHTKDALLKSAEHQPRQLPMHACKQAMPTWVPHQNWVVLGAPTQNTNDPANLLVTPNHRVQARGLSSQVIAIFGQRLKGLVCMISVDLQARRQGCSLAWDARGGSAGGCAAQARQAGRPGLQAGAYLSHRNACVLPECTWSATGQAGLNQAADHVRCSKWL